MKEFKYKINGKEYNVKVDDVEGTTASIEVNGAPYKVELEKPMRKQPVKVKVPPSIAVTPSSITTKPSDKPAIAGGGSIKAPLPGIILSIDCKIGDAVKKGQKLVVLEAMKMENNIPSDRDGEIAEIKITKGDSVLEGVDMILFK
jgi:biotin carboxyl carrier protein